MNNKVTHFPQYRRITGKKVYYKIVSEQEFIELTWIGNKLFQYTITAKQYPEMLKIMHMLSCESPYEILGSELENYFDELK